MNKLVDRPTQAASVSAAPVEEDSTPRVDHQAGGGLAVKAPVQADSDGGRNSWEREARVCSVEAAFQAALARKSVRGREDTAVKRAEAEVVGVAKRGASSPANWVTHGDVASVMGVRRDWPVAGVALIFPPKGG